MIDSEDTATSSDRDSTGESERSEGSLSKHAMEAVSDKPSHKLSKTSAVFTVAMASLCLGFGASIMRTYGIMYVEVQKHYNSSAATGSNLNSLFFGCFHFFGPVSTVMLNCLGYTITIAVGSLLLIAGVISSAFVPSAEWLYFSYGVMPGIGVAIINHTVSTFIGKVFDRRRPMANNMLLVVASLIMMPLILQHFVDKYGLPCSLLRVTGLVAISFPTGFVLSMLPKYYPMEVRSRVEEQKRKQMFSTDLLKEKFFLIYLLFCGFDKAVKLLLSLYVFKFANSLGIESIQMSYILTADAGLSTTLRLLTGWIYSKKSVCGLKVNRLSILLFFVGLRFISCLLFAIFATDFNTLFAVLMLLSVSSGCIGSLPNTVMADLFGHQRLSSSLGLKMFAMGFFAVVTSPLTEYLLETMSTDDTSILCRIPMVIRTVCALISFLLIIPVWKYSKRPESTIENATDDKDDKTFDSESENEAIIL